MTSKATIAILAVALCTFAAACGTAGDGGKAASSPADAQVTPASSAEDAPAPLPPPNLTLPRPIGGPGTPPAADTPSGGPCAADADCVPAVCCHAKTCVAAAQKPSCAGTMCTLDCRMGTMDCGGGNCVCKDGSCAAELKKPGFVKGAEEATKPQ
jgi:hypothetical protein